MADTDPPDALGICAEILLEVSHRLLSRAPRLAAVQKIYSHPQHNVDKVMPPSVNAALNFVNTSSHYPPRCHASI